MIFFKKGRGALIGADELIRSNKVIRYTKLMLFILHLSYEDNGKGTSTFCTEKKGWGIVLIVAHY